MNSSNDQHDELRDRHDASGPTRSARDIVPPLRTLPARIRRLFRLPPSASQLEAELRDEFEFHIKGRIEQLVVNGYARNAAEREVREKFGNYETHWQHTRRIGEDTMQQTRRMEFGEMLWSELQHSARALIRTPTFSIIAIVTLALGIGATTANYSVLDAVVLRPLPYRQPQQLVSILHPTSPPGSSDGNGVCQLADISNFETRRTHSLTLALTAHRKQPSRTPTRPMRNQRGFV